LGLLLEGAQQHQRQTVESGKAGRQFAQIGLESHLAGGLQGQRALLQR